MYLTIKLGLTHTSGIIDILPGLGFGMQLVCLVIQCDKKIFKKGKREREKDSLCEDDIIIVCYPGTLKQRSRFNAFNLISSTR